jgi:hypothetical protein
MGVQFQAVVNKNYYIAMIARKLWGMLFGEKLSVYVNTDYSQLLSTVRMASKLDRPDYCSRMAKEHLRLKN